MRIVFAANIMPEDLAAQGGVLASARYRALIPVEALKRDGLQAEVISYVDLFRPTFDAEIDLLVLHQPKIEIAQLFKIASVFLDNMDRVRARGGVIAIDVSDFKFTPEFTQQAVRDFGQEAAQNYRQMLDAIFARSNAVTAATENLADLMRTALRGKLPVSVIDDVVEVERQPPRFAPGEELKLLWFGLMGSHVAAMQLFLNRDLALIEAMRPTKMTVVCEPLPKATGGYLTRGDKRPIQVIPWSVPVLERALADCDLVVLPFDVDSMLSRGKSNNRALQALYAGRAVVAHPIDSYLSLGDFIGLDRDLPHAVATALADPAAMAVKLERGQAHVAAQYSPATIGRRWRELATQLLAPAD